jgi:hypothetical protein
MTHPISLAVGKLDDALVSEWAQQFYERLPKNARDARERAESAWFNAGFLAKRIEQDDSDALPRLFRLLPPGRFAALTPLILGRWLDWPGKLADEAVPVLAANAPDALFDLFDAYLQRVEQGADLEPNRFMNIQSLAQAGEAERRRDFALRLRRPVQTLPDSGFYKFTLLSKLLCFAAALRTEDLEAILAGALATVTEGGQAQEDLFKELFLGLFGHAEYLDLAFSRDHGYSEQRLAPLFPLFAPEAPLEQLDGWLDHLPPLAEILPALEQAGLRAKGCAVLSHLLGSAALARALSDGLGSLLALAGCIHGHARDIPDTGRLDLAATVDLLAADLDAPRGYPALFDRLAAFPRAEVAARLAERLSAMEENYGAVQIVTAMGGLGWEEFVPCLVDALGQGTADFLIVPVSDALVEIGGPAQRALIARWSGLDRSQRIQGLLAIAAIGGTAAADFAVARFKELLNDDAELCCELVLAAPDSRLLDLLRFEARRKQPLIDRAYYIAARLLDRNEPAMEGAGQRALAERQRQRGLLASLTLENIAQAAQEFLMLDLRCPDCGDVNAYEVAGVIMARAQDGGLSRLVADEFPCASCGKEVEFEFTDRAAAALSVQLMFSEVMLQGEPEQQPLIRSLNCRLEGKVMPIAEGLRELRRRIGKNPQDARSWFQLAGLLSHVNRPRASLAAYRESAAIAPNAVDVTLELAQRLADEDRFEEAFGLLLDALQRRKDWGFILGAPRNFSQEFADLYDFLRRELGRENLPAIHPATLAAPPKKAGRNDPCPCGSGKKYKKCCGD